MSTTNSTDYLSAIKGLDEDFQSYAIIAFTFIILIIFIGYVIYLTKLEFTDLFLKTKFLYLLI